jgi:hypothetical protein
VLRPIPVVPPAKPFALQRAHNKNASATILPVTIMLLCSCPTATAGRPIALSHNIYTIYTGYVIFPWDRKITRTSYGKALKPKPLAILMQIKFTFLTMQKFLETSHIFENQVAFFSGVTIGSFICCFRFLASTIN